MAKLHPLAEALLEPIRASEANALYAIAVARIDAAEGEPAPSDDAEESLDPFAPIPGESESDRARRQIKAADDALGGLLRRELAIAKRGQALIAQFNDRPVVRGAPALKTIAVVSQDPSAEKSASFEIDSDLFSGARLEALNEMLTAWTGAVVEALDGIDPRAEPGL